MPMYHNSTIDSVEKQNKILEEMSDYFTKNKFNPRNKEHVAKLEQYLYSLFAIRAEQMGYKAVLSENNDESKEDGSILFFFDKKPYIFKEVFHGSYDVTLGDKKMGVYKRNPRITIVEKRFKKIKNMEDIYEIIGTLYHELEHAEQEKIWMSQESSKEALSYATYAMVRKFCGERNYKKYYNEVPQEMDAYSNFYLREHLHTKNLFEGISLSEENASYYYNRFNQSNPLITGRYEEMLDSEMHKKSNSKKMERMKEYIENVPMLKKKYVIDSNKQVRARSSIELVNAMKKELQDIENDEEKSEYDKRIPIKNCKGMYFELIYNAIQRENLGDKELQNLEEIYGEETSLCGDMSEYFSAELSKCKTYAKLGDRYCKEEYGEKRVGDYFQKQMELIEEHYDKKISMLDDYRKRNEMTQEQGQQESINYDLNTIENAMSPETIKRDTIRGGVKISEINQMIRYIKDKVLGLFRGNTINMNEKEDSQNR